MKGRRDEGILLFMLVRTNATLFGLYMKTDLIL